MSDHPKISIISTVYNTGPYLRPAVESILAQTFTDFELLLVDDGSHDGLTNEAEGDADDQSAERDDATENALRPALNERPNVVKLGTARGGTTNAGVNSGSTGEETAGKSDLADRLEVHGNVS